MSVSVQTNELTEIYAQFGHTFSLACSVEGWLQNAILTSDFVTNVLTESRKAGKPILDKEECDRKFEGFLARQHRKMFGKLAEDTQKVAELEEGLKNRIDDARRRRNYLAHHFWRERGGEVLSRKRRPMVLADLVRDAEAFEALGKELEEFANARVAKLGLNAKTLRARVDEKVRQTLQSE